MPDDDLIKLYSGRILELAADIPRTGHLPDPHATATRRSPVCGSNVSVELRVADGKIVDFAQDVRACALGQAAASVVGANVVGCTLSQVETARDQMHAMLTSGGPAPDAPFGDLVVLSPAKDFSNRHKSILLALEAAVDAMKQAAKAAA